CHPPQPPFPWTTSPHLLLPSSSATSTATFATPSLRYMLGLILNPSLPPLFLGEPRLFMPLFAFAPFVSLLSFRLAHAICPLWLPLSSSSSSSFCFHCCLAPIELSFAVVLQVSVPFTSLFKTVTVRCGHCTNLLSVNMRGLHLPPANQIHVTHPCLTPSYASLLEGEDVLPKDGFYATAAAANMGVAPF
ncbi:hypothetical protein B296_00013135, partial [Ensete ventricosum]